MICTIDHLNLEYKLPFIEWIVNMLPIRSVNLDTCRKDMHHVTMNMIEDDNQKEKIEKELLIPIEKIIANINPKHNFNSKYQVITPRKTRLSTAPDSPDMNQINSDSMQAGHFFDNEFSPNIQNPTHNQNNNMVIDGMFGSYEQFEMENQGVQNRMVSAFDFVDTNNIQPNVLENNNNNNNVVHSMENELQQNNDLFSFNGTPIRNQS